MIYYVSARNRIPQVIKQIDDFILAPDAPPVANAGEDKTIQLPTNSVTLDGSRSTDDVRVITYDWKLVSGDRSVRLRDERRPVLTVDNLQEGVYVFELMVSDGKEQLDRDTVTVNVLKGISSIW